MIIPWRISGSVTRIVTGTIVWTTKFLPAAADFSQDILANYLPELIPDKWGLHIQQAWNMRRDMFLFWPWYRQQRDAVRPLGLPDDTVLHDWTVGLLKSGRTYDLSYRAAFEYPTAQRLPQLPDVPTVAEFYPGFDTSSWNGFFAPAGTPQPIVDRLAKEVIDAAKDPQIIERLVQLAILPLGTTQPEFIAIIEQSKISNREAMKAAGLKSE